MILTIITYIGVFSLGLICGLVATALLSANNH